MDGWTDGWMAISSQLSRVPVMLASLLPRHFCHVYKMAIFPLLNLCNHDLKWRAVTAVQLLTAGASYAVWNTAYRAIS